MSTALTMAADLPESEGVLVRATDLDLVYMPDTPFETHALAGVSLDVRTGDVMAVIGATGSGKSSFVQAVAGLLEPTGALHYRADFKPEALHERIGLVFQMAEDQLFERSVLEDVAFGPGQLGWPPPRVEQAVRTALETVDLPFADFARRAPQALSGGEKRRVALAGILAMQPVLLMLDEPTAGLDSHAVGGLAGTLERLRARGTTIVCVSHDLEFLGKIATRLVVFSGGRIVADGPPRRILGEPDVLAAAGLTPPFSVRLLAELARRGWPVSRECISPEEALDQIVRARKHRGSGGGGGR